MTDDPVHVIVPDESWQIGPAINVGAADKKISAWSPSIALRDLRSNNAYNRTSRKARATKLIINVDNWQATVIAWAHWIGCLGEN